MTFEEAHEARPKPLNMSIPLDGMYLYFFEAGQKDLKTLADNRLVTIKAMSGYLDDVAEALGVAKPSTPVEGIGACWKVIDAIHQLQKNISVLQTLVPVLDGSCEICGAVPATHALLCEGHTYAAGLEDRKIQDIDTIAGVVNDNLGKCASDLAGKALIGELCRAVQSA